MQDFLAELRDRAWIATALMAAIAAGCAALQLHFLTASAAMTAGTLIMWKAEEGADEGPSMLARLADAVPATPASAPLPAVPVPAIAPAA